MGENVQEKKSDEKYFIGFLPSRKIRQSEMSFVSKNGTPVFCEGGGWGHSSDIDFEVCFFAGLLTL